ncbi:MAG: DNA primase noncatalytic subunit PriX [Nitrososphaerota archaeon]
MQSPTFELLRGFPRRVMAGPKHFVKFKGEMKHGQFLVNSLDELNDVIKSAENMDVFVATHSEEHKAAGVTENLMLDFDDEEDLDVASEAAVRAGRAVESLFEVRPMIYFSGAKGYHVVIPFMEKALPNGGKELPSFLTFIAEKIISDARLSKNRAIDWQVINNPLRFMRVVGSLHYFPDKEAKEVKLVQAWDHAFADPRIVYGDFSMNNIVKMHRQKRKRRNDDQYKRNYMTNPFSKGWIEELLQHPVADGRHRLLWHVIAPYLINVKRLSLQDAFEIAQRYFDECSKIKPLDASFGREIIRYLKYAEKDGYPPWRLETIKEKDPQLFEIIESGKGAILV